MAHLCVPQNQALGVCRGFVPDIQVRGTHGREDLVNATITSNAEEEETLRVTAEASVHCFGALRKSPVRPVSTTCRTELHNFALVVTEHHASIVVSKF